MANVLVECITAEQRSVVRFLGVGGGEDIHNEMYPVYGGKYLSSKAVHKWMANVSLMTKRLKRRCNSDWEGFAGLVKLRVKCWGGIFREIKVVDRFEYHILYILYPFLTHLLSLPRS
jgi:hypothetical protein